MNKSYNFKLKHDCPPPEEVKKNYGYAISINPQVQHDKLIPHVRYARLIENMNRIMNNMNYSKYVLYPELSKSARWHYHGMVWITDIIGFFSHDLMILQANATVMIKEHEDWEWELYCKKQRHLLAPYLDKLKLQYKVHERVIPIKDNKLNWDYYKIDESHTNLEP